MFLLNIRRNITSLYLFVFNSTQVETAALKIFCVMIPSVYTCRDFGLFRVVRPYEWGSPQCKYYCSVKQNDTADLIEGFYFS